MGMKGEELVSAIRRKDYVRIKQILEEGVNPDEHVDRELPLNIAIENQDFEIVKILIDSGVNCDPNVFYPLYPLVLSVEQVIKAKTLDVKHPTVQILHLLLNHGAKASELVHANFSRTKLSPVKGLSELLSRYGWYDAMEHHRGGGPP